MRIVTGLGSLKTALQGVSALALVAALTVSPGNSTPLGYQSWGGTGGSGGSTGGGGGGDGLTGIFQAAPAALAVRVTALPAALAAVRWATHGAPLRRHDR